MRKLSVIIDRFLHGFMATALALIVILVFTNVVLRYAFSSGIIWAQELSRYIFVWLIFLGAIAAFKENEHLAVNMFVKRLPPQLKKIAVIVGNLLMLYVLTLVFQGSWKMTVLNINSKSPATGLPLSVIYVMGLLISVAMGLMLLINLYRVITNKIDVEELIPSRASEEMIDLKKNK